MKNVRRPEPVDAAAVAALVAAFDTAHTGETDVDEAEIRDWWRDTDLGADAWLVEVDGRLAGYASLEWRGERPPRADGYVDPELAGRGVGALLVDLTEARARESGARWVENAVLGADARAGALLASRGYRRVRHYFRMRIELGDEPPAPAPVPDGIELTPFDPERDAEAVHAAIEEAFAEEWGFRRRTLERWREDALGGGRADPTLWRVARADGEIAGVLRAERHGFVPTLAVCPPWRRRGLGLALLTAGFAEYHRRGERVVTLAVDAENPSGATRLYERAGMTVHWRADLYEKELA